MRRAGTSRRSSAIAVIAGLLANNAITALQALLLIPRYVQQIGARTYGAWLASGDVLTWMPMADLGTADLLVQRVGKAHAERDQVTAGHWLATGGAFILALAAVVTVGGLAFSFAIPHIFHISGADAPELQRAFAIACLATAVTVCFNTLYGYARAVQHTGLLSSTYIVGNSLQLVTSAVLVYSGHGLDAISSGFVARALGFLAGMALFVYRDLDDDIRQHLRISRQVFMELRHALPATSVAVLAFALMNQTELLIVSLVLGPVMATIYMLNRKAIELARAIADSVTWGAFGPFAHLVASPERHRALTVFHEVLSLRVALAVIFAAGFVLLNRSFVTLWVGPNEYAGLALTVALAANAVVGGSAFLVNYLYRAAGAIIPGGVLLVAESALRVVLMIALCAGLGLVGLPIAGIASSLIFGYVTYRRLRSLLGGERQAPTEWAFLFVSAALIACATLLASYLGAVGSWRGFIFAGMAYLVVAVSAVVLTAASLRRNFVTLAAKVTSMCTPAEQA